MPVLRDWKGAYFVTLTVRSIRIGRLKELIDGVLRAFDLIRNKYIKRYQRGSGIKLVGIKSLECNFNAGKRTYNPHLHLIVPNKETADILIKEWLNLWTSKWTSSKAQKARPVEKMERDMIEIIKYGSKIFTEPDTDSSKLLDVHTIVPNGSLGLLSYNQTLPVHSVSGLRMYPSSSL